MDNPNPIRYSDLITPDDSIKNLIVQLDELITQYDAAKSKIQGAATEAAKSMKGLSGATEEQREKIQLVTTQTNALLAEYKDTDSVLKRLITNYKDVTLAQKEAAKITKLVDEANRSAEGSYNQLSALYRLNKIRLNEMSQAERESTQAGRQLEAETKAIYERMNELQKATGKSQLQVGQYERALSGLLGVNPKVVSALTDSKQAAAAFGGVMKALAGPIGLVIGAIGAVTAAFKLFKDSIQSTQQTGDSLNFAVAEWEGTWEVFKKSIATVDFSGFITGAREAAAAGRNLKEVMDETFERANSIAILRASMTEENAILQETMRDQRKGLSERLAAADAYLDNMRPIYEQEKDLARDNRDAQLEYLFSVTNRRKFATEEEREAAKQNLAGYIRDYNINRERIKIAKQYLQAQKDIAAAEDGIRKAETAAVTDAYVQQRDAARKVIDNASASTKELAKIVEQYNLTSDEEVTSYVESEKKYLETMAAAYNDEKRIVTMRNNLEAQQTAEAKAAADKRAKDAADAAKAEQKAQEDAAKEKARADAQAIADARAVLNAQLQSIQLTIAATQDGTNEMLALRLQMLEKQREIEKFENSQKKEELRQDEQAIDAKYNALKLREQAKFDTTLANRNLKALQDFAEAEFSLLDRNERQKTVFRLEQEKKRLETILEINKTATEKMTVDEIRAIKETIKSIEKEAERTPYKNMYELLGIGLDSEQQDALNTALGSVKDAIGEVTEAWLKEKEAAVDAAKAQVDAAQQVLNAEIEARNNGYANSVETAQKELELARSNQEKAERERQKAQRAQLAADSIEQSSSLITATANIWKALSGIPLAGPGLAITAITTMWASFIASKIRASQVAGVEKYGEGTVELLEGGSHASGHDIDLGRKKDGTRRRAEGGEFFAVINKRSSKKFRNVIPDVINSLNNGTFADRYERANTRMGNYAIGIANAARTDVTGLERDVAAIRKQGDESRFVDGDGNTVIRYRNLTRKIIKN